MSAPGGDASHHERLPRAPMGASGISPRIASQGAPPTRSASQERLQGSPPKERVPGAPPGIELPDHNNGRRNFVYAGFSTNARRSLFFFVLVLRF